MFEVRRDDDGELCGHVSRGDGAEGDGAWLALTVFGGELARCPTRDEATLTVLSDGLASLADHWLLDGAPVGDNDEEEDEQIVCIQSASPGSVTVALGYSSMPGVPTLTLRREELMSGRRRLRRRTGGR